MIWYDRGRRGRGKREKKESATQDFEIGKKKKEGERNFKKFSNTFFFDFIFQKSLFSYLDHCGVFIALSQG